MKLKKSFIALFCILIGLCFSAKFNVVKVEANSYTGQVIVNSYIYNKYGQRLKYFRGKRAYLKAKHTITFSGVIRPISNENKRYFLNCYTKQNYWFPYRKIHGQYYYPLTDGGYIKVRNVTAIGKYLVCSNGEKVIAQNEFGHKTVWLWNKDKALYTKRIKSSTKLIVDGYSTDPETNIDWLRVKNTGLFISSYDVKKNPLNRINLLDCGYLK